MYELSVISHFSGAHRLKGYDGPCGDPHGHNWEVEVFLRGARLDKVGMLADFAALKSAVAEALSALDHKDLNGIACLSGINPTSENLARHIYVELSSALNCGRYAVSRVRVSETQGTSASYWTRRGARRPPHDRRTRRGEA